MGDTVNGEPRAPKTNTFYQRVLSRLSQDRNLSQSLGLVLSCLVMLVGALVLSLALKIGNEFGREFGVAFLTSGMVTLIYELHARAQKDRETMAGVLRLVFGDLVTENFWDEFKRQIFWRKILRKDAKIEIRVEHREGLPEDRLILVSTFSYKLHCLRPIPETVAIVHRLNFHIRDESDTNPQLPIFEQVTIGDDEIPPEKLNESRGEGKTLEVPVVLTPKDPVDVRVRRRELTYVPGTYNFVLAELTGGINIYLDGLPEGCTATILCGPEFPPQTLSSPGSHSIKNKLFLPGHCIELRLERAVAGGVS